MARLKSLRDLHGIYRSGQIAGSFLNEVGLRVKAGTTTAELDTFAAEFIGKHGARAAFLDYHGYPAHICVSVNEQIVHGIPGPRVLAEGDVVSVDVGVVHEGYFSDTARTYFVGDTPPEDVQRLLDGTRQSLGAAILAVSAGEPLRFVSKAIEHVLRREHLGIIRELTGHGTGAALHEEPTVYNFDPGTRRPVMENGMVLAIEPMATLGGTGILLAADNWTYYTADGSLAAHFEHTVACWNDRAVVLTDPADQLARDLFGRAA